MGKIRVGMIEIEEPSIIPIRLWVDDVRPMPAEYNYHAKTATEAQAVLSKFQVAAISLDHDLGLGHFGDGHDVASFIEAAAYRGEMPKMEWKVHSSNPSGAQRIQQAMESAERFWEENKI